MSPAKVMGNCYDSDYATVGRFQVRTGFEFYALAGAAFLSRSDRAT
jgi:hypothetical protein